jgi:hypothetical protein
LRRRWSQINPLFAKGKRRGEVGIAVITAFFGRERRIWE